MKAIVIYESHWGNTAAVARAIAQGIGGGAQAFSTADATGAALAGVDLIVAGAPLLGFSLPTEGMLKSLATTRAWRPGARPFAPRAARLARRVACRTRPRGRV